MNPKILNTEIQEFISKHLNSDISRLLLKGTYFKDASTLEIVEQIEAKTKCEKKLPTWFNTENIYYPNKLNIEQTSSEVTAQYKSELLSGSSLADITGGFGVDAYYFSKTFDRVDHVELSNSLSAIAKHNFKSLNCDNIKCINEDGLKHVIASKKTYDWIYIDPSRRHESKGKVFFLKDCLPDVPSNLDHLFEKSDAIAIKTSPLLDITAGIAELAYVKDIHVIAVKNEVKELLWILKNGFDGDISIKTVNIIANRKDTFNFQFDDEASKNVNYGIPNNYLYEPNSAILKAGGFNSIANKYNINKLHQHSHLYTSSALIDFPGRRFDIELVIPYNKKALRALNISKANITTRNFPESVHDLRKKFRITDGGSKYLFFTTNLQNQKIVIFCNQI